MKTLAVFGQARTNDENGHWLSVSDLMAGLMMIFLFIAISFMRYVQIEKERIRDVVVLADATHTQLYEELEREFHDDLPRWKAELDRETLTVRFKEPEILFAQNSAELKPMFEEILIDFFPRYVAVINGFEKHLDEVRIEGHTSSEWATQSSPTEAYFRNMELSQRRTRAVLEYCYQMEGLKDDYPWMKRRFSAVGLSSSRPVLISEAIPTEDMDKSRRVEFTVKTNFERRIITEVLEPGAITDATRAQ